MNTAGTRNPALDALRAAAIALVFFSHVVQPIFDPIISSASKLAPRGVDLFFVLSGYLVGGMAIRELSRTGRLDLTRFWQRRWLRTLPAYFVALALYSLKEFVPHRSPGLVEPWAYLVFLQTYALPNLPDFSHSWSLCVEEHFYLGLPLVLISASWLGWRRPQALLAVVGVAGVMLCLLRLTDLLPPGSVQQTHRRTDALCVGVMLAALQEHSSSVLDFVRRYVKWISSAAIAASAGAGSLQLAGFEALWQTGFALACGLWVLLGAARAPWLSTIGENRAVSGLAQISYSLYLFHPLVIGTLNTFEPQRFFGRFQQGAYVGFALIGSVLVASFSYGLIERPFLRLRDGLARARL